MLNAQPNPKLFKRFTLTWVLILPLLFYAFFVGGKQWLSANLYETSHRTLSLYVSGLKEILNKYKALPEIYADHPLMLALLEAPDDVRLRHKSNMLLEKFNAVSGASATYVLNAQGITLAASNWNLPKSFVGRSFSFRPYFQNALASGRGRFFALGTTSLQRGYYMSSAIQNAQGETKGVMVVKVDVTKVEKEWNAPNSEVLVTDDASIVFLASRPKWLYNAFKDPSPKALVELGQTRRYADKTIGRLPFTIEEAQLPWSNRFNAVNKGDKSYLVTHLDIPSAGWQVWILANYTVMINTAFAYAVGAVLLISLVAITIVSLLERRQGLLRAHHSLENAANELEHQVEKRTSDLKRAQNELVQAGKMAALGQMSVGINHELNQPLTAIRAYADNAGKFLDQGRSGEALENLKLISGLSERMGDIILRLKIFARESSDERTPQVLQNILKDTRNVVNPRLKKDKVELDIIIPRQDILVLVNDVRLEQVLVNLINNAIDALDQDHEHKIVLTANVVGQDAVVSVQDFGAGIPDDVMAHLFEPFFTTKKVGLGLGLGLSISSGIISEFGGELKAHNLPGEGAVFSFNIPLAPKQKA